MPRSRAIVAALIALLGIESGWAQHEIAFASCGAAERFGLAYWEAMPGPMTLPVFDARAAEARGQLVVVGGCTRALEATKAIQTRHPVHGWLPIGMSLLEARADATLTPLPNGRHLVLGGWSGVWGQSVTHHADGETLDLLVAGSNRRVPAWETSLEGHCATPLPDGRVAVTCGCALRIFDPAAKDEASAWSEPTELARPRRHHAAALVGFTLILAGGDEEGSIESIDLDSFEPASVLWDAHLPGAPIELASIAVNTTTALVAGGFLPSAARTSDETTILDLDTRTTRPGPDLGLSHGACDLTLSPHPRGILVLDGEWRIGGERGNADAALLLRPLAGVGERARWDLPKASRQPGAARRVLVRLRNGTVEALGGYRFIPADQAAAHAEAGVQIESSAQRLIVDADGVGD